MIILAALTAAACSNPVDPPEDHPEAGGVVILAAGTNTVLTQSIGGGPSAVFSAPLTIGVGETLEVEIRFLDDSDPTDLSRAFLPDADEGESLRVTIANPAIAEYHDHDDHGDFEAKAVGQTTVTFDLMHGGHSDFVSGPLTIIVE